ncbi:hypothetical protein CEXT_526111 [Caerostris extrusa]|uniref:Uncharacterized protein n=1 Tax=Caerostris extrusa TaxID=172846 RepID=A0AAV4UHQ1_CAEEX|nr:hypothetical protein CEXT_526111 [Caerostris extrusa]
MNLQTILYDGHEVNEYTLNDTNTLLYNHVFYTSLKCLLDKLIHQILRNDMEDRRRPSSRTTDDNEDHPTERNSPGKEKGHRESMAATAENVAERAKEFLTWTFTDVFDWNPRYLKSIRGILNID